MSFIDHASMRWSDLSFSPTTTRSVGRIETFGRQGDSRPRSVRGELEEASDAGRPGVGVSVGASGMGDRIFWGDGDKERDSRVEKPCTLADLARSSEWREAWELVVPLLDRTLDSSPRSRKTSGGKSCCNGLHDRVEGSETELDETIEDGCSLRMR